MTQLNSKVNPPVDLENDAISLNEGLDLTTSNLMVDKGALRDSLNFEVVDRLGYQTLQGFDRYDSALSPDQVEFWTFSYTGVGAPVVGQIIASSKTQYGVCVRTETIGGVNYATYAKYNADAVVPNGETLFAVIPGPPVAFQSSSAAVKYTESPALPAGDTADDIYADYQVWNNVLRGRVERLPEQIIGLHWYRDRLYAVANELRLAFESGGTAEVEPNQILITAANNFACRVLRVELATGSGTWASGTATGTMLVEPVDFFDGVQTVESALPPTSGNFDLIDRIPLSGDPATTIQANVLTARTLAASDPEPTAAGMWRTKPEPDPGWERIESGWVVEYNNGFSFADELREVERAIDNNFQFGTDDQEGLSALWSNGADLEPVNEQTRVNEFGWFTDTGVATDDANLEADDGSYLFGDIDFGFVKAGENAGLIDRVTGSIANVTSRLSGVSALAKPEGGTQAAGSTSARSPMLFLGLGPIFDLIPRDAQVSGFEIRGRVKAGLSFNGGVSTTGIASAADALDLVIAQTHGQFRCSAQFGEYLTASGKFQTVGQKRSATIALPSAAGSYSTTTSGPSGGLYFVSANYTDAADSDLVIGSSSDLFGLVDVDRTKYEQAEFGIAVFGEHVPNATTIATDDINRPTDRLGLVGAARLSFDRLLIRVYYDEPSARYYVATPESPTVTKVLTFDLVKNTVLTGQLRDANATGRLQVVNIRNQKDVDPNWTNDKFTIKSGDKIYLDPALSREVATVTADMTLNGFAPLKDIVAEGSRYQFITANFFAREDWDGFYGVSGAGKAFSFAAFDADNDGDEEQYIQFITTNTIVPDEDKPRHIAFHQYHLALGYKDGTVRFSVPGEPENFDGLQGAAEVGVGDRVTGLLGMRGKALGVFCESSVLTILGDSADTFNVETLSPYSGAIEYTVIDNGGSPLYCDYRGISSLEQTDAYGNFLGYRVSQKVTPWLLPRMTRSDDLFEINNAAGVVCAVPVRSKNQYRIFFRDGFFLVYTMMPDKSGAFTYGRYYLNEDQDQFFVPIAHSSQTDQDGKERIHMAHFSPRSTISSSASRFAYEFERGLGFDGSWFDAFFETAFSYKDPFKDNTIRKVRADGLTKGYGPYTITVAKDYDEDSYSTTLVPLSLPRNPASVPSLDFKPATTMANVAKEGRCLSFRIARDTNLKTLVPPTVFQVLLVQYQSGGKRDA